MSKHKWDFRDVSNGLKKLREILLGRKHKLHGRFTPLIAPRTIPTPDIPRGPYYKYSEQYYCHRNALDSVKPPVVAPVAEGAIGTSKPNATCFEYAPTPGASWWWDGHCYYGYEFTSPPPCSPCKPCPPPPPPSCPPPPCPPPPPPCPPPPPVCPPLPPVCTPPPPVCPPPQPICPPPPPVCPPPPPVCPPPLPVCPPPQPVCPPKKPVCPPPPPVCPPPPPVCPPPKPHYKPEPLVPQAPDKIPKH